MLFYESILIDSFIAVPKLISLEIKLFPEEIHLWTNLGFDELLKMRNTFEVIDIVLSYQMVLYVVLSSSLSAGV